MLSSSDMPGPRKIAAESELGSLTTLRIAALVIGGVLVGSAIVVAVPLVVVEEARQGYVRGPGDAVGEIVSVLLSLLLLAVALRAHVRARRARRHGPEPFAWLSRAVPACMLVGAAIGVWFGRRVIDSHDDIVKESAWMTCREALGDGADDAAMAACLPMAIACDEQESAERRANPNAFYPGEHPAERCVREKVSGALR